MSGTNSNDGLLKTLLAFLFVSNILYCFLIPPFEIRDEPAHFAKSAQLALFLFPSVFENGQIGAALPVDLKALVDEWPNTPPNQTVKPLDQHKIAEGIFWRQNDATEHVFASFWYIGSYPATLYVGQALGLRLAREMDASPLGQFYAGRMTGGIFAFILILLSVRLAPFGGRSMLVLASLPGLSGQLSSYSADSCIIGLAYLTIAILLRWREAVSRGSVVLLSAFLPLLVLAKGIYMPIILLGLSGKSRQHGRNIATLFGIVLISLSIFVWWFVFVSHGEFVPQHYVNGRTLEHVVSATPHDQLKFVFSHPFLTVQIILTTILTRAPAYVVDMIGRFSWFNVLLPLPVYFIGILTILTSFVFSHTDRLPTLGLRCSIFCALSASIFLIHFALYLVATSLGDTMVEGVQGRYFVPLLPLLPFLFGFKARQSWNAEVRGAQIGLPILMYACGAGTCALTFWKI